MKMLSCCVLCLAHCGPGLRRESGLKLPWDVDVTVCVPCVTDRCLVGTG